MQRVAEDVRQNHPHKSVAPSGQSYVPYNLSQLTEHDASDRFLYPRMLALRRVDLNLPGPERPRAAAPSRDPTVEAPLMSKSSDLPRGTRIVCEYLARAETPEEPEALNAWNTVQACSSGSRLVPSDSVPLISG